MKSRSEAHNDLLVQVVENFWETFPPFWHRIRAYIRLVAVEQFNISVEQFHILRHIRRGISSVSELAEAKNISRPAISQAVDALVHKGLITRTTDEHDRRHIQLTLTASGNALLDAIFNNTRSWMRQLLSSLEDEELQSLVQGMQALKKIES
jgi:DNA-binding MarR family transcriptional regulator